jgi:hypothetical protein
MNTRRHFLIRRARISVRSSITANGRVMARSSPGTLLRVFRVGAALLNRTVGFGSETAERELGLLEDEHFWGLTAMAC